MTAASRSLATALSGARFASGLLHPSYTINRDTTLHPIAKHPETSSLRRTVWPERPAAQRRAALSNDQ